MKYTFVISSLLMINGIIIAMDENKQLKSAKKILFLAVQKNKHAVVRECLGSYPSLVNSQNRYGETPLHVAKGRSMVKLLLKAGADVHLKNEQGNIPLMKQLRNNEESIPLLLAAGSCPNATDEYGTSVLYRATLNGCSPTIVEALIKAGADVSYEDHGTLCFENRKRSYLPLFEKYGYKAFYAEVNRDIDRILKNDAAYLKDEVRKNTMEYSLELLQELFEAIYRYDKERKGPHGDAIIKDQIIKRTNRVVIFRYPSYEQLEKVWGESAASYAKKLVEQWLLGNWLWKHFEQESLLAAYEPALLEIQKICTGEKRISKKKIPFSYKAEECNEAFQLMLKYHLFKMARISYATEGDAWLHLQSLLKGGVDINTRYYNGQTALLECYELHYWNMKYEKNHQLLLEHGADPNIKDDRGRCPLFWAVVAQDIQEVELLIKYGARTDRHIMEEVAEISISKNSDKSEVRKRIMALLESVYRSEDVECCICAEIFPDNRIGRIPCYKKSTVNHKDEFLCQGCYQDIKKRNNACPLCRGVLAEQK